MPVVGLGDQRDHARAAVAQRRHERVVGGRDAGPPGGAEGRQLGVPQVELLARAPEELGVLGVRARPAALDEPDAEVVDVPGDVELVQDGEVEPLLLGAVTQGRVVDVEVVAGVLGLGLSLSRVCADRSERWDRRLTRGQMPDGHIARSASPSPCQGGPDAGAQVTGSPAVAEPQHHDGEHEQPRPRPTRAAGGARQVGRPAERAAAPGGSPAPTRSPSRPPPRRR